MNYATAKDLSLSTLRRYIKSGKVLFKLESGRYFIWDENPEASAASLNSSVSQPVTRQDTQPVLNSESAFVDLQKAKEEIAELKTLIAFYEERLPKGLDHL